jgi:hypothetical protein
VRVVGGGGAGGKQAAMVRSGSSYCSQSDLALTFGLGRDTKAATVEVEWPSGTKQRFTDVPADRLLVIDESKGIVNK